MIKNKKELVVVCFGLTLMLAATIYDGYYMFIKRPNFIQACYEKDCSVGHPKIVSGPKCICTVEDQPK